MIGSGSGIQRQPALLYSSLLVPPPLLPPPPLILIICDVLILNRVQLPLAPELPFLHHLSSFAIAPLLANWRRLSQQNQQLILPPFSTEILAQEVVGRRVQMMGQWRPSDALLQRITAQTLLLARYPWEHGSVGMGGLVSEV